VLSLFADVDGVSLWVDGVHSGVLEPGQLRSLSLSPGTHDVRAVRPDYPSWERRIDLAVGSRLFMPLILRDKATPLQDGPAGAMESTRDSRLLRMPAPVYPAGTESVGAATVWADVTVDERGNVSTVRIMSGPAKLQRAAIDAIRLSSFRPARRDGLADGGRQFLPVKFNPVQ
jgi:TonB family protein